MLSTGNDFRFPVHSNGAPANTQPVFPKSGTRTSIHSISIVRPIAFTFVLLEILNNSSYSKPGPNRTPTELSSFTVPITIAVGIGVLAGEGGKGVGVGVVVSEGDRVGRSIGEGVAVGTSVGVTITTCCGSLLGNCTKIVRTATTTPNIPTASPAENSLVRIRSKITQAAINTLITDRAIVLRYWIIT